MLNFARPLILKIRDKSRVLHQRRDTLEKHTEQQQKPFLVPDALHGDKAALFESGLKILFHIRNAVGFAEVACTFKVVVQTAVIEVYRAAHGLAVV